LLSLGRAVRAARDLRRLTLRDLSAASGVSLRFLNEVEAGRGNPSVLRLAALADALGVSASELLARAGQPLPKPHVALLGLRGAGKTSVGQRVAGRIGAPFVELDRKIEEAASLSLAEIFALHGEDYYRRLEKATLESVLNEGVRCVLATGGGIVTSPEAMALLKTRAQTIWLRGNAIDHWKRVVKQGDRRPMTGRPEAMAELRRLLESRRALYAGADHTIMTTGLSLDAVVDRAVSLVREP
jgi:XRE family aerobic/anaerobic benzoate catabolism transcriptional regulator